MTKHNDAPTVAAQQCGLDEKALEVAVAAYHNETRPNSAISSAISAYLTAAVPADIAALVGRLRADLVKEHTYDPDKDAAASALTAAYASLAAVKKMYAHEGAKALHELDRAENAEARVFELEAERDCYLPGLQLLATSFWKEDQYQAYPRHVIDAAEQAARRALTGGKADG